MTNKPLSYSFPPLVGSNPKVLILGSMPGIASLQSQQYYAHPRNAFWPIMAEIFGLDINAPYAQRCQQLTAKGIAVWDVLKACHRPGSLDQHIDAKSVQANDFRQFLIHYLEIEIILFNGAKAEELFRRHVLSAHSVPQQKLAYHRLPSTSPAHAVMTLEQKMDVWGKVLQPSATQI